MDIFKAILNIRPGARFAVNGNSYEGLEWYNDNDLPPPTEEEIQVEIERLQAEYEHNQYQRNRASAYPSITDQLDAIWKGGDAYNDMLSKIMEVKDKYPKSVDVDTTN